jgi:hypothetical protein
MLERKEITSQSFEIGSHFTFNSSQLYFVYRTENGSICVLENVAKVSECASINVINYSGLSKNTNGRPIT